MLRQRKLVQLFGVMALLACLGLPHLLAQEKSDEKTIRAKSSNVVIDLIVTDRHGRHMPGLSATDFTVYEDGVPQKIVSFTPSANTPSPAATPPATTAPEQSPKPAQTQTVSDATHDPHLLTIVLDLADNRLSNTKSSSEAVLKYLDKSAMNGEYVAIYYIDKSLHMALPFTNDLTQARETLNRLQERNPVGGFSGSERTNTQEEINELVRLAHPETQLGAVAGEVTQASSGGSNGPQAPPSNNMSALLDRQIDSMRQYLSMQNTFQARAVFTALRAMCFAYRDLPGRKNVVLFSEGFLNSDDARPEMEAVAEAANRANVAIYVIDPEGIEINPYGGGTRPTDTMAARIAEAGAPGARVAQHGGETKFDRIKTVGNISRGDQLEWLAETTGGLMVKRTNDLLPAFAKVLDDSRDYYTLAYSPQKSEVDGKFHAIKVEVSQHGLQLRYRKGYWAVPTGQAVALSPLAAQLIAGLHSGSLRPSSAPEIQAQLLLTSNGQFSAPVSVSLPGNKIPLEKEGDNLKAAMTLLLIARDGQGNIVSAAQRAWNVHIPSKDRGSFEKSMVTVRSQVPLAELQTVSIDAILQLPENILSRVVTTIRIPDSDKSAFGLTSILLSDRAEQATCSDPSDSLCFMNVRLNQPLNDKFSKSSRLIVYFAAKNLSLDPQTKKPRLGAAFSLKSNGALVKTASAENLQSLPGPGPDSVLVLAEYDLKSLSPGTYTLQVTASDLVKKTSLQQQSEFVIE